MMWIVRTYVVAIICGLIGLASPSWAQQPGTDSAQTDPNAPPGSATVERIMEQAVRNIGRRYNLNEEQLQKTDALMKRDVRRFLTEHADEVWPIIRALLASGIGSNPPKDREEVMRIGKKARPLVKLAKEAILSGNEEWRLSLTPEQKKVHDFDLAEMENSFKQIDENFASWERGEPNQKSIFPQPDPKLALRSPPTPPKPTKDLDPVELVFDHSLFDVFVEQFIHDYGLNEGQSDSARSILKEFKDKARDFMTANRVEFANILLVQEQAVRSRDRKRIAQAETLRKQLLKPVYGLFEKMEERLKSLLSTAQLARYNAKHEVASDSELADTATPGKSTPTQEPADSSTGANTKSPTKNSSAPQKAENSKG